MLNITFCNIETLAGHRIGNKTNGEDMRLAKEVLDLESEQVDQSLRKYFLSAFANMEEAYCFTFSNEDHTLNPIFQFAKAIFDSNEGFLENSQDIARHLYETALHPQIKSGDLFVAKFKDLRLGETSADAVGIFKSENRHSFLQLNQDSAQFKLDYFEGINIDKLDKGSLILNTEENKGYRVYVVDKTSRGGEAAFWKEGFLNIVPVADGFHQTNEFMGITKQFVTKQLNEDFEVTKTDQIDLLNRSVEYFKTHDEFDKDEFEETVFADQEVIDSFRRFDQNYREENDVEVADTFDISNQAVKKQARAFKSVLKLDKNFHVYIHGNRDLIEKGVDENGRKYYKIYYQEEN